MTYNACQFYSYAIARAAWKNRENGFYHQMGKIAMDAFYLSVQPLVFRTPLSSF